MSDKAVLKQFKVLRTAVEELGKVLTQSSAETPKAAPKKTAKAVKAKAAPKVKAAKTPATLKGQAQAVLDAKKFHHKSKETATLKSFVASKADLRKAAGREMSAKVAEILGLPPPKKPGPAPKAKTTKVKASAPKAEKKRGPKPKAAKAASKAPAAGLKAQAQAVLDTKKFHHKSKEAQVLKSFIESKADGRSQEARTAAIEVCTILGLPPPKKPGPAPKKGKNSGKGQADAASDAPKPSSTKSTGAKPPRAIEAVEMVLGSGATLNAAEIIKALEEKGWLPASNDPKTYVSFILSQNKEKFERDPVKGRGYYRLAKGGTKAPTKEPKPNGNGTTAPKEEAAPIPAPTPVVVETPEPEEALSEPLPTATEEENPFDDSLNLDEILS
jgi:hypothetical protein